MRPISRASGGWSGWATSRRLRISVFTQNADVIERPSPASTSFLMASVFPSSMAGRGVAPARRNQSSMMRRTVPPCSNRISGSAASVGGVTVRRRRHAPRAGVIATSSSV